MEIAGLPEFLPSLDRIDVQRLLEILDTPECREFRVWLCTIANASDSEILDRVGSLRARLASFVNTGSAKVLRFLAATGVGFVPVVGGVAGVVAGAIDSFLVGCLLPSSGVWTFANRFYPSIFKPKNGTLGVK